MENFMKKLSLALIFTVAFVAALAIFSTPACAQDQQGAQAEKQPPSPDQMVAILGMKLNLTDDQKKQILPIITARQQKMKEIRSDSSLRPMQKKMKMKEAMDDGDAKINALLNDQQKKDYAEFEKEGREKMQERRQNTAPVQ
jgi:hypothetical protein